MDEEVADPALLDAYARLRDVLVDSVERHEAQHRLDYARPDPLPMPNALELLVGPADESEERRFASQARAELSAYLAEIARDQRTTRVNLTMLARFLFKRRLQGMVESYAAVRDRGGPRRRARRRAAASLVNGGNILRERAAPVFLALVDKTPEELRAAAARLWGRLFERGFAGAKACCGEVSLITPPSRDTASRPPHHGYRAARPTSPRPCLRRRRPRVLRHRCRRRLVLPRAIVREAPERRRRDARTGVENHETTIASRLNETTLVSGLK